MIIRDRDANQLAQYEKDNHLFERKYAGMRYWQYIRFQIFDSIYDSNRYNKDYAKKVSKTKKTKLLIRRAIKDIKYLLKLQKSDLLCFAPDNRNQADGDYYRFYSLFDIAPNSKKQYLWTDWTKESPGLDISLPMLKVNFEYYLRKKLNILPSDKDEKKVIIEIRHNICEKFGDCISVEDIIDIIQKQIYINKYLERFYKKVIKRTGCKAISLITYYDILHYPLFDIAKEMGIPIIEFQHGCIANHYSYCLKDNSDSIKVPDYFLTFGKAQESFTSLLQRTKVVPVGFYFHNKQIDEVKRVFTDDKLVIIYPESCDGFEECIDEFIKCSKKEGYKVAMKLHPVEVSYYNRAYPILSKNKDLIIYTNEFDNNIYHYLKMARHHIVINTTVGLQAAGFKHTNICVCTLKRHDTNKCLIDNGVARGFNNSDELLYLIKNPLDENKSYSEQLFMEHAEENIVNFFNKILKG